MGFSLAALPYFGFFLRWIDNVELVGLYSSMVAIALGMGAGGRDRPGGVREFLFTLPVRRMRRVGSKVFFSLLALNALTGLATATVLFDLPLHLYRLASESTLGTRIIPVDFPAFYPFVFFYSSTLFLLVLHIQWFSRGAGVGTTAAMAGVILAGVSFSAVLGSVQRWPRSYFTIAVCSTLVALLVALVLLGATVFRFRRMQLSGGASS